MERILGLVVPLAFVVACAGESPGDEPVVVALEPGASVEPEGIGPPVPGPTPLCVVPTPVGAPPPGPGDLDKYFGCAGYASVSDAQADIKINSIAVQPDDTIVAVGESHDKNTNHNTVWVARFTSAGKLDSTFGAAGIFTTSFTAAGFGGADSAESVAIASNGTILVGGGRRFENDVGGAPAGFVLRLLANGTLDASFGTGGSVVTTALTYVKKLRLTANGNIVVAGEKCNYTPPAVCNAAVGRFSGANGAPDPSFGVSGVKVTTFGGSAPASALGAALSGDDVVVIGTTTISGKVDVGLARYGATGLVSSFGAGGNETFDFTARNETGQAITAVGANFVAIDNYSNSTPTYFALVLNLLPTGTLNGAFGFGGITSVALASNGSTANDVLATAGGKLLVVGTGVISNGHARMAVARLNSNGATDATFSDDGATQLSGGADDAYGNAAASQSSGRVVIGGWMYSSGGHRRALLARVIN